MPRDDLSREGAAGRQGGQPEGPSRASRPDAADNRDQGTDADAREDMVAREPGGSEGSGLSPDVAGTVATGAAGTSASTTNPAAPRRPVERASTTDGLPVSPSMGPALDAAGVPGQATLVDRRVVFLSALCVVLAVAAAFIAQLLMRLIWYVTRVAFHGDFSLAHLAPTSPPREVADMRGWMILVPVAGGVVVGLMARFGSKAIRGHGIPEAMEQVLLNQSRIPPRLTFLKPASAAVAIGTGGPFGAEGPIIATGGALGSLIGQLLSTTAAERKTLLAAGAAAGMAATFGSPVSAVLLAVELLLFEFRPRSIIPVALAAATAAGVRLLFGEEAAVFPMPDLASPGAAAIFLYMLVGAAVGLASVGVTRVVYLVEDAFEHIFTRVPLHWMWWPAVGGLAVGLVGYFHPLTLGVGYSNISNIISSNLTGARDAAGHLNWALPFIGTLVVWKFVSWSISLGSGTSGGTLAPLFTIGGGLGVLAGAAVQLAFPAARVDVRIAGLVGMAAIFAGASRALLASAVFAFETTLQPLGLLPLLGGCTGAFLVSCLLMRNTIMTEKIARRGVRVPAEYHADYLEQIRVSDAASRHPVTLSAGQPLEAVRAWIGSHAAGSQHQGYPVLDEAGHLLGVVTRRQLLDPAEPPTKGVGELLTLPPKFTYPDLTLRDAADHMVNHDIGRLPVVDRQTRRVVGMLTRSDLLGAHRRRLQESAQRGRGFAGARGATPLVRPEPGVGGASC